MPSFECEGILCNGAMDKSAAIIDQDIYIFKVMHHRCMHVTFLFTFNHGFLYEDLVYAVKICVLVLF